MKKTELEYNKVDKVEITDEGLRLFFKGMRQFFISHILISCIVNQHSKDARYTSHTSDGFAKFCIYTKTNQDGDEESGGTKNV